MPAVSSRPQERCCICTSTVAEQQQHSSSRVAHKTDAAATCCNGPGSFRFPRLRVHLKSYTRQSNISSVEKSLAPAAAAVSRASAIPPASGSAIAMAAVADVLPLLLLLLFLQLFVSPLPSLKGSGKAR